MRTHSNDDPGNRSDSETPVSDLDLASLLLSEGARLVRVQPTLDPGRWEFVLVGERPRVDLLMLAFTRGNARVEPRRYSIARKVLQRALRNAHG